MSIYTETDLKNLKADIKEIGIGNAALLWIDSLTDAIRKCGVPYEEAHSQAFDVIDDMVEEIMGEE